MKLKLIFPAFLVLTIIVLSNCSKSDNSGPIISDKCQSLITDTLGTGDTGRVFIPNAFTPNNDGLNELIRPITKNIDSILFTIYDPNDMVVFSTTVLGQGWQPIAGPNTVVKYFYKIQAVTSSGKKIGKCGNVYSLTCYPPNPPKSFYYFEDMLTANGFTGITSETLPNCF